MQKRVFQLVRSETGCRTPGFVITREQLAELLRGAGAESIGAQPEDLVLCLGDIGDDDEFEFGTAPLMRVDTFVQNFGGVVSEQVL